MLSDVPLPSPVGAVRIGKIDGNFVVNPKEEDLLENTDLDLVVAGTEDAILMVEAGANEISEAEILDALDIAHDAIKKLCAAQRELAEKAGKPKLEVAAPAIDEAPAGRRSRRPTAAPSTRRRPSRTSSSARTPPRRSRRRSWRSTRATPTDDLRRVRADAARGVRPSSRSRSSASASPSTRSAPTAARRRRSATISIEVGVAPRTHGSALFTRGQTQALSRRRPGHAQGGDAPRHARPGDLEVLLAPLQLPAVLGGRGRVHARPQAP